MVITYIHVNVHVLVCRFQPTDEEKEMYKNYLEDKTKLQNADTFLLKVHEIMFMHFQIIIFV